MNTLVKMDHRLLLNLPAERGFTEIVGIPNRKVDPALMIVRESISPLAADYRSAARRLLQSNESASRFFITSPGQGDGKTCTAFNLAWALSESGRSVLLVELNFAKPHFRIALGGLKLRYGLENAIRGWVEPVETVFSIASTRLHIAAIRNATPAGSRPPGLDHLQDFLDWGSQNYDMMLIDSPPVISSEWKEWFSELVGPSLLVVREAHTPLVEVRQATKLLGSNLAGVLLNATRHGEQQGDQGEALARPKIQAQSREQDALASGSLAGKHRRNRKQGQEKLA